MEIKIKQRLKKEYNNLFVSSSWLVTFFLQSCIIIMQSCKSLSLQVHVLLFYRLMNSFCENDQSANVPLLFAFNKNMRCYLFYYRGIAYCLKVAHNHLNLSEISVNQLVSLTADFNILLFTHLDTLLFIIQSFMCFISASQQTGHPAIMRTSVIHTYATSNL